MLADLRDALRQLRKAPGFTATVVITLALGIGATTAVFSVIYATLMNPYPYPAADRIVRLTVSSKATSSDGINLSGPQIKQLQQLHSVEGVLAMDYDAMNLTGHDLPENVNTISLISNGFHDLGVPPIMGRGTVPLRRSRWPGAATGSCAFVQVLAEALLRRSGRAGTDTAVGPEELRHRGRGGAAI